MHLLSSQVHFLNAYKISAAESFMSRITSIQKHWLNILDLFWQKNSISYGIHPTDSYPYIAEDFSKHAVIAKMEIIAGGILPHQLNRVLSA